MFRLRARYVFPVAGPPLEDGVVTIEGARIVAVGHARDGWGIASRSDTPQTSHDVDLGNAAIVPGFVNAHTHLELSHYDAPLGHAGIGMADWIRLVLAERRDELTRQKAIAAGVDECCRLGTTTLADITSFYWPAALRCSRRMRATPFYEVIAPTTERACAAIGDMHRFGKAAEMSGGSIGISPHAPYTVRLDLWARLTEIAVAAAAPLAVHLAESREEMELLQTGRGPLRELLDERRGWSEGLTALFCRPIEYLRKLQVAPRVLVVHGNYLDDEEIAFCAARRETMSIVYCPRTHAFFGHARYPLPQMLAAGVNVAVGTDSRASSPDLSVHSELRHVANAFPEVPRDQVLRLGTRNGAQALGIDHQCGTLESGKIADLAVVSLPDASAADPHDLLFDERSAVAGRYFNGKCDQRA